MHAEKRLAVSSVTYEAGRDAAVKAARGTMIRYDVSARHQPTLPSALAQTSRLGR